MSTTNTRRPIDRHIGTEDSFDIWAFVSTIRRHMPLFLATLVLFSALAFAYTYRKTPQYVSTVRLLIEPRSNDVLQKKSAVLSDMPTDSMAIDTEVQVLESNSLAEQVVKKLNLRSEPFFNQGEMGPATLLLSRLDVKRKGLTYVIDLSVKMPDSKLAAKIANGYAQTYLQNQINAKLNANSGATMELDSRMGELRNQVQKDEEAVQRYKVAYNLMSSNGATMAEQEVSTLNTGIASARADYAEKTARLSAARQQIFRGSNGSDTWVALNSDVVKDLRRQRAEVSRRQADLESRYGPLHPDVAKGQKQLVDFDAQIQAEINRVISGLEAEVNVSRQRFASLSGSRSVAAGALRSNNIAEVRLMELERTAEASRAIYEAFLNRSKEVAAQSGMQQSDARVFSPAFAATSPSEPNLYLNLVIGLLSGVFVGASLIGALELFDKTFRTSTQVENILGLKHASSIPIVKLKNAEKKKGLQSYVVKNPFSLYAESMRNLRTYLSLTNREMPVKTIMFTSSLPGEGKTTTALSFARAMAVSGSRVLLVDADIRRHTLTDIINLKPQKGIEQALQNLDSLKECVLKDKESGADLILVSNLGKSDFEPLNKTRLSAFIDKIYDHYDYIVFDSPPVMALAETRILASMMDSNVLLVQWNKTSRKAVETAKHIIEDTGSHISCVCLTQVDVNAQMRHGYGDSMHYYSSYKKYYTA